MNNKFTWFLVCKGLSNDDVGVQRAPHFRRCGRGLVSKPATLLEKVGGATVRFIVVNLCFTASSLRVLFC